MLRTTYMMAHIGIHQDDKVAGRVVDAVLVGTSCESERVCNPSVSTRAAAGPRTRRQHEPNPSFSVRGRSTILSAP